MLASPIDVQFARAVVTPAKRLSPRQLRRLKHDHVVMRQFWIFVKRHRADIEALMEAVWETHRGYSASEVIDIMHRFGSTPAGKRLFGASDWLHGLFRSRSHMTQYELRDSFELLINNFWTGLAQADR